MLVVAGVTSLLMRIAAVIATALLLIVTVFQLSLALGAPFGRAAWGGQHQGVLPRRLRIASGVAGVLVYPLIILIVLSSAGVIGEDLVPGDSRSVQWFLTGLFTLGGVANLISRSSRERYWGPLSIGIAICCAVVAVAL
jgi:hypothetical protein